jgi:hypothetical protein
MPGKRRKFAAVLQRRSVTEEVFPNYSNLLLLSLFASFFISLSRAVLTIPLASS